MFAVFQLSAILDFSFKKIVIAIYSKSQIQTRLMTSPIEVQPLATEINNLLEHKQILEKSN